MSQSYRVAFIGTGGRSVTYARYYVECGNVDVVAVADPSEAHRQVMAQKSGLTTQPRPYDDWRQMLREQRELDGIIIATPNHLHAEQATAALDRGLPVALEKPLATTLEDCQRIVDAERSNGGRTLVGFVMRSMPFYCRIHEIISSGAIGRVLSIQADELVGQAVTSLMCRSSWRRWNRTSGGVMLEKCCHDMDMLSWMMGSRPVAVSSFGGQLVMSPNPALPDHCDGCAVASQCLYYKPGVSTSEDASEQILNQFVSEQSHCIYNIDKDICDTQSVAIQFENGAVANFLLQLNAMGDRASRNFHAVGTRGRVYGNLHENAVHHYDNLSGKLTTHDTTGDGSGHGGGDRRHALQLRQMMMDPTFRPASNAAMGYLSAATCFAADRSRLEGRRVDLRYRSDGMVDLH